MIEFTVDKSRLKSTTEKSIERSCIQWLKKQGLTPLKYGVNGYPDRLILCGNGAHFWIEFKTATGGYTKAQKIVIPQLQKQGETVFTIRSLDQCLNEVTCYLDRFQQSS